MEKEIKMMKSKQETDKDNINGEFIYTCTCMIL